MKLLLLITAILAAGQAVTKVRYDNYRLYKLTPQNDEALTVLKQLQEKELPEFSFWSPTRSVGVGADVLVAPSHIEELEKVVASLRIDSEVLMENVQEHIDAEGFRPTTRAGGFDWTSYHTYEEYNSWLTSLPAQYPGIVSLFQAGATHEGRIILGVKVSYSSANENNAVFLESLIHAREWITGAVNTYILNQLLTSRDPAVRNLAESHDWYVVPIFNPDGFVFTYTSTRTWRKTRVRYTLCYGADPNRNWAYQWNNGGSSASSCSDTYRGPSAFSEPSTKSLSQYISTIASKLVGYISFHSYSQLLLIPYGHTSARLDNYNETYAIGIKAAQSLAQRYGTRYTVGNVVEAIYVASGGSMDWVKGNYQTPLVYTYELRDTGRYGFILPAELILPTAEETLDSLVTIFEEYEKLKSGK